MDNKRNVVFIAGKDPSIALGGHVSYVRAHAMAAREAGFVPHIFCPSSRSDSTESDFGVVHRIRTAVVQAANPYFHKSFLPWQAQLMAPVIVRFFESRPGTRLIHAFASWGYVGVLACRRLRQLGVKTSLINGVYTTAKHESLGRVRGLDRCHGPLQRLLHWGDNLWIEHVVARCERRAYVESNAVVLNYDSVRTLVEAEFGPRQNIRKLPYTSEIAFQRLDSDEPAETPAALVGLPTRSPKIVSVSRHDPRKGLHVLLQALSRLRANGVDFSACLVSGGPLLASHRQLAARLGLGDVVAIPGWVPDPSPFLRHADVFVLPSLEEGSGSVALIEAMEMGLPVVASRLDGIPEDLVNGESGVLVEPADVSSLSDGLRQVLTDNALRQRLAQNARKTFETRFSPDAMTRALGVLYEELLRDVE